MLSIALFGGSFDPVHVGHLLVARATLDEVATERIFFIPASRSPFKPELEPADGRERARLLRLALAGMPQCEVDDQELQRGGVSYTIDTVRRYADRFPGVTIHWVVGADHVPSLPRWREAASLAELVRLIVIPRPAAAEVPLPSPFEGVYLRGFPLAVSSSQIRERIRRGQSIDLLTTAPVAEAIRKNRLYL
jgi:nicotinate-nucleotide adenylyltransferase